MRRKQDLRSLGKNASGIAAVEFSLILPIIVLLFFGMLEAADALTVSRRVSNAANAVVDLVGQAEKITPNEVESIFTGAQNMIGDVDGTQVEMTLTSVTRNPAAPEEIIVEWSVDEKGEAPYAPGDVFTSVEDEAILVSGVSLLVADVTYTYDTGISKRILGSPLVFEKRANRWPRIATNVRQCPNDNPDC